jgi:hypothetical protein
MSKIYLLVNRAVQLPPINDLNLWAIKLESDVYLSKYPTRKIGNVYRSIIDVPENSLSDPFPDFERVRAGGDHHILRGEYIELDIAIEDHGEKISVTYGTTRKYTEEFPDAVTSWHALTSEEKYNFSCKLGDLLIALGNDEDEAERSV